MATSFSSRLFSMREKKGSNNQESIHKAISGGLKLTLPSDESEKTSYEPTAISSQPRTSMRLLKGRILDKQESTTTQSETNSSNDEAQRPLRLVINDDPVFEEKKPIIETKPMQKRVLIAKEEELPKRQEPKKEQPSIKQPPQQPPQQKKVIQTQEKQIPEQEVQESHAENQNDLIMCTQGCGRKFNRKALEKHAKACKIVFMSKRKEFNSQAKRITSKEQMIIAKQTKQKEKKDMRATKDKGFDKAGDNWKAASEDFRSALKALKKDEKEEKDETEGAEEETKNVKEEPAVKTCQYCEKKFNELFMEKHLQNCVRKKEKERERERKKTSKK